MIHRKMPAQPQSSPAGVCARPGCGTELGPRPKGQPGRKKKYCKPNCQVLDYQRLHPRIDLTKMPQETNGR